MGGRESSLVASPWCLVLLIVGGLAGSYVAPAVTYSSAVPTSNLLRFMACWSAGATIAWLIVRRCYTRAGRVRPEHRDPTVAILPPTRPGRRLPMSSGTPRAPIRGRSRGD